MEQMAADSYRFICANQRILRDKFKVIHCQKSRFYKRYIGTRWYASIIFLLIRTVKYCANCYAKQYA